MSEKKLPKIKVTSLENIKKAGYAWITNDNLWKSGSLKANDHAILVEEESGYEVIVRVLKVTDNDTSIKFKLENKLKTSNLGLNQE